MAANITKASKIPPSIYFGGCCFGGAFYVGVHEAMVEKWGKDFHEHIVISGGSAGTIFAVGLALGKSPEFMAKLYTDVAEQAKTYGPIYYASVSMTKGLEEMLAEDPLAYKKLEGKCCFGTTSFFSKHRWHLSWESNEDLLGVYYHYALLKIDLSNYLFIVGMVYINALSSEVNVWSTVLPSLLSSIKYYLMFFPSNLTITRI
jgi:hypothetical protein